MVKRQQSHTRIPEFWAISVNDILVQVTGLSKLMDFKLYYYCYYSTYNMRKASLMHSKYTHVAKFEQSLCVLFQITSFECLMMSFELRRYSNCN